MAITVVGGANIDITASCGNSFIAADSNPGRVETSYGGVGRNIAHNLALMGAQVRFATVFGGDSQADGLVGDCRELGFDLSLSSRMDYVRSSYYISINDGDGERPDKEPDDEDEEHGEKPDDDERIVDTHDDEAKGLVYVTSILSEGNVVLAAVIGGGAVLAVAAIVIYKKKK